MYSGECFCSTILNLSKYNRFSVSELFCLFLSWGVYLPLLKLFYNSLFERCFEYKFLQFHENRIGVFCRLISKPLSCYFSCPGSKLGSLCFEWGGGGYWDNPHYLLFDLYEIDDFEGCLAVSVLLGYSCLVSKYVF